MSALLYLSNWGLDDGLTHSTVFPHIEVLRTSDRFSRLVLVTVEREPGSRPDPERRTARLLHAALWRHTGRPALLARIADYLRWPAQIGRLCREHGVGLILARTAPAGALAHLSQRHLAVPYIVESFEPHARYMLDSGSWSRLDPRYVLESRWEEAQKRDAVALLPVAEAYRRQLIAEGVPAGKILTLPCTVDTSRFRFSDAARRHTRHELGVDENGVLGVYVGKFGDNYYGTEAFWIFARFAERRPGFRMLVLTPMPAADVQGLAREAGFPQDRLVVATRPHADVPRYLCAADVAFAPIRPASSRRFASLVKVGEYWASGLPVVITEGIGEESDIIREHSAGAVVTLDAAVVDAAVSRVEHILVEPDHRTRIAALARRFRSRDRIRQCYSALGLL